MFENGSGEVWDTLKFVETIKNSRIKKFRAFSSTTIEVSVTHVSSQSMYLSILQYLVLSNKKHTFMFCGWDDVNSGTKEPETKILL